MKTRHIPLPFSRLCLLAFASAPSLGALFSIACTDENSSKTPATTTAQGDLTAGLQQAIWAPTITITYGDGYLEYKSDGIPNHSRQAEYALPNNGAMIPDASSAYAGADPTRAQSYNFKIPTRPKRAASPTAANLGTIGVMISGASLFNPYEADSSTVALKANFTVKNSQGQDVSFLDSCNGHPNPMGAYHYHGLPTCITATVDAADGPSHLIGIAFDGYPIYGNRDQNGRVLAVSELDACNGIESATPEFPNGVYHYVLMDTPDAASSIRCFTGEVDASLTQPNHMMGMPMMNQPRL